MPNSSISNKTVLNNCTSTSIFNLYFEPGCGMYSTTDPIEIARRKVICKVFEDISNFINTPLTASGNKVNIWVRDINAINSNPNGVLGLASSYYNVAQSTTGGIADGEIWKTITLGVDSYANVAAPLVTTGASANGTGIFYHGMVAFNFNTNNNPSINWHTNLTTLPSTGTFDLYSVALHEVTHAMGFASLIDENGNSKMGADFKYYTRYDRFLKNNANNQFIITNPGACSNMYNYAFNTANLQKILHPGCSLPNFTNIGVPLDATFCSDAIKYVGSSTVPVYTPRCFEQGSSLSHFEDQLFPSCAISYGNNSYFVMSNANGPTAVKRYLKPEERNTLCDIGYSVKPTYGSTTTLNGYFNYGGSTCGGIKVAGVNDGLNADGSYTFTPNQSATITIIGTSILSNDKNATSFECLQDLTSGSTITITAGNATFESAVAGLHLLRYVPVNTASGQRGNITYIYVYVKTIPISGCAPTPSACNLVVNGAFEENLGVPSDHSQIIRACGWVDSSISPDYFYQNTLYPNYSTPTNLIGIQADKILNNKGYGGFFFYNFVGNWNPDSTTHGEIMGTKLSMPLQANTSYQISFDLSRADDFPSGVGFKPQMFLTSQPITPNISGYLTTAQINSGIFRTSPSFVSDATSWKTITFNFTTTTGGEQYLYLGGLNNTPCTIVNALAGTYFYIDNVAIIPTNGSSINLSSNLSCSSTIITNLSQYLVGLPTTGVFSGDGVSFVNGQYVFNPSSLGIGFTTITYTYNNGTCIVALNKVIELLPLVTLVASNDVFNQSAGSTSSSFLINDTINGVAINSATTNVTTTQVLPAPSFINGGITINPNGTFTVLYGTTLGTYVLKYKLNTVCGISNTATITVTVFNSSIVMSPKVRAGGFCYNATTTQTSTTSIFDASQGGLTPGGSTVVGCTINGVPCSASNVVINSFSMLNNLPPPAGYIINPNGTSTALAGTLPIQGGLTLQCKVCPIATPTQGCLDIEILGGIGGGVAALPDLITMTPNGVVCSGVANVYDRDFISDCGYAAGGIAAAPSNTTLSVLIQSGFLLVNTATGEITSNGTAFPGVVTTIKYQLCNNALPGNCVYSFATVTFVGSCASPRLAASTPNKNREFYKREIYVFPNPSSELFYLQLDNTAQEELNVAVYNLLGQKIIDNITNSNEIILDLSNYPVGSYLLKIAVGQEVLSKKIIKR